MEQMQGIERGVSVLSDADRERLLTLLDRINNSILPKIEELKELMHKR
jgi:hypothetical protein